MPTYPDVPTKTKSVVPANQINTDISDGGVLFAQDLNASAVYDIELEHPLLTTAQVASLRSFYTTNKGVLITTRTLGDGEDYDCVLLHEPELIASSGIFNTMVQKLRGSRN